MNGKARYLLAAAFLILALFCAYFYVAIGNVQTALLREKVAEKRLDIDLICEQIDKFIAVDDDWGLYDYQAILAHDMEHLDNVPGTFAALYNERLECVSYRTPTYTTPFEPTDHPEFVAAANANRQGDIELWFEAPDVEGRTMHVYYRWVPTDASLSGQLLTVVAISVHSIDNGIASWVVWGAAALIMYAAVLVLAATIILCELGHVRAMRGGRDKWREKI